MNAEFAKARALNCLEEPQEPHKSQYKMESVERSNQTLKMWDSISASRLNSNEKRKNLYSVKVFVGGANGLQRIQFEQAMHRVVREYSRDKNPGLLEIRVEYLDNDAVSRNNWLPKDLIDYLLDSDLHFILSHVHQGL